MMREYANMFIRTVLTNEAAKRFISDFFEKRKAEAVRQMDLSLNAHNDMRFNQPNAVAARDVAALTTRTTNGEISSLPMMGPIVETFENLFNEANIDNTWRMVLAEDSLTGSNRSILVDILNIVEFDEWENGDTIPAGPYKATTWTSLLPRGYAGGVSFDLDDLEKNPMDSINGAVSAIRFKAEERKTIVAYAAIQALITAANAAAQVTAFNTSIEQTIMDAYVNLITRNNNQGFALSGTTPVVILAAASLEAQVETAFRQIVGQVNDAKPIIITKPISRGYTLQLAADLGISGTKVAMFLPGRKNRHGQFKNLAVNQDTQWQTNSTGLYGIEKYNQQTNTIQCEVINIV